MLIFGQNQKIKTKPDKRQNQTKPENKEKTENKEDVENLTILHFALTFNDHLNEQNVLQFQRN